MVVIIVAALSVAGAAILVYGRLDPSSSAYFPKCPFYFLTGLKCPGCGSQRAMHELLHFDVIEAVQYNAVLVAAIPFLTLLVLSMAMRGRFPRFHSMLNSAPVIWAVLGIVVLWWIIRNVAGI